ncbi:hypothetical protein [Nostoc sp. FACHB-280]|uniref:hypothetical protein n=1 Tax=Nostoc sp. FACHB-280 TaxID=2692839 RepID=UPI00168BFBFE|nr:hypothetical protein [Nostoc sp. FACHB-280]MBD2495006.1 hypothetical protein [Nostoc sp. FACHB-280]
MAEPTLTNVFGTGATQDASTLTISKSALATVGLTASGSNSAESLFVAIILLAQSYLNDTNQANNINQSVSISTASTPSFVSRDNTTYIRDSIAIEIDKLAPTLTIDPDDY